jgi:hypothetical protein
MALNTDEIARILTERGVKLPCHRCGNRQFTVMEDYSMFSLQKELKGLTLGGPAIPVCLTACRNCGAITPHALGALGLMPDKKEEKKEEK